MQLHEAVAGRLEEIDRVLIETQEAGMRIINKSGPLAGPADRDHCLQYIAAIPLIFGRLTAADYEDDIAGDVRIDQLRARMQVSENEQFTRDYMDPDKRAISNALQVFFTDGTSTPRIEIEYPIGHPRRRAEGVPVLLEKFRENLATRFDSKRVRQIIAACQDRDALEAMPVPDFMELWVE